LGDDPPPVGIIEVPPSPLKSFFLRHHKALYLAILAVAIGAVVSITLLVEKPDNFQNYIKSSGYLGVFLMAVIGSSSPVWPLPGSWAVFIAAGFNLNPVLLALTAGIGEAIGESTAYMAGYGGQVVVVNIRGYRRVEGWMMRRGGIILFLVSAIPNVLIKAAVVSAGALRFPFWKFFLFCCTGKIIKSLFFAIAGYFFFDALFEIFDRWF